MFDLKDFVLNKWVPALRSGRYEQGKEYLCRDNKYCCLGVACELLGELKRAKVRGNYLATKDEGRVESLEHRIAHKLKMSCNGTLKWSGNEHMVSLAGMNDDGMSFEQIADFLEEQVNKCL